MTSVTAGHVLLNLPTGFHLFRMQLLPNSKILLVGYTETSVVACRLNSNGFPDTTFGGGDGIEIFTIGKNNSIAGMDLQPTYFTLTIDPDVYGYSPFTAIRFDL
jgi:hypothetical protein